MSAYVLDASALLRFTDKEPGYNRVRDLLNQAAKGQAELFISAVNWSEIVTTLFKRESAVRPVTQPTTLGSNLAALPISIMPVYQHDAEAAAAFKYNFNVPLADAFAGSLTQSMSTASLKRPATLVTADYDFKSVPSGTIKIEFLPIK